jgi:hypothetical protein
MLDFDLVCENIYKKYGRAGIYFSNGLMDSILNLAKQSDTLRIYFTDRNDIALRASLAKSISIILKKGELEVTKSNINAFFRASSRICMDKGYKSLHLCFSFYRDDGSGLSSISDCGTLLMPIRQIKNDLSDIFKKGEAFYDDNDIDGYFGDI